MGGYGWLFLWKWMYFYAPLSQVVCLECRRSSISYQPFVYLSLPLNNDTHKAKRCLRSSVLNLYDCILPYLSRWISVYISVIAFLTSYSSFFSRFNHFNKILSAKFESADNLWLWLRQGLYGQVNQCLPVRDCFLNLLQVVFSQDLTFVESFIVIAYLNWLQNTYKFLIRNGRISLLNSIVHFPPIARFQILTFRFRLILKIWSPSMSVR